MRDSLIGSFAVSKAGHDKEQVYLIIGETDKNLYLTDGRFHMPDKPKKKNKKHPRLIHQPGMLYYYGLFWGGNGASICTGAAS